MLSILVVSGRSEKALTHHQIANGLEVPEAHIMPTVCQSLVWMGSTSADICSMKDAITKGCSSKRRSCATTSSSVCFEKFALFVTLASCLHRDEWSKDLFQAVNALRGN